MIEIPIIGNIVSLTGTFDDVQAYVIPEDKSFALVIIKKVLFKDTYKFITGCSVCCNLNSTFLLYLEASTNYMSSDCFDYFVECTHIRQALSSILNNFNFWRPIISVGEIQEFLMNNCIWENNSSFFVSDRRLDFCGKCNSDGIVLFKKNNKKWRCGACGFKLAAKCRHGHDLIFPNERDENDEIMLEPEDENVFESNTILSINRFSGKYELLLLVPHHSNDFFLVNSMAHIFFQRSFNLENYLKSEFLLHDPSAFSIIPENKSCLSCSRDLVLYKRKPTGFIILNLTVQCNVFYGQCENECCTHYKVQISFMGTSSGLINCGNKFFIGVEIIVEYMNLYAKNGLSFNAWFETKMETNRYANNTSLFGDVHHLKSYTGLLHEAFCLGTSLFHFEESSFKCCDSPKIISMDAIVNSVKRSRMTTFQEPWITSTLVDRCSKRSDRQLEKLNEKWKSDILEVIQQKTISFDKVLKLRHCDHKGVKAFSFCFYENANGSYSLKDVAKMFGMTLIKTVAAANSIVPSNCVQIIKKQVQFSFLI